MLKVEPHKKHTFDEDPTWEACGTGTVCGEDRPHEHCLHGLPNEYGCNVIKFRNGKTMVNRRDSRFRQ